MVIKIVCLRCRQKLMAPAYAEKITCPQCGELNPIIKKPSPATSREQGKIIPPLIGKSMEKLRKLLLGNTQRLSGSSGSSSSPPSKLCALDHSVNQLPAKKRAVLCGVSYKKWKYKLKGTINDVMNMKTLLTQTYGFLERNILVLTVFIFFRFQNLGSTVNTLVNGCQKGDSLVFYYSGHGLRQPDFDDDELDGFDETICPVDFLREGMIVDNDIYATIVKPLSEGVTLHAIVDACHSGTILDLEHVYERDKGKWIDNRPPSGVRKKTSGGIAYSISACEDNQVAADTSALNSNTMNGAMTYILIDVVRGNPDITYGDLLDQIETRIEDANQQGCFGGSRILSNLFGPNLSQKPLLSASEEFPVYERKFKL
ncbi:hypothetical protein ES288_D01G013300v1 [Gossypium darwinii]|uniref:Peptidase C14 caspase domain-containing protein n=1 Tax=Gossypium darwinii TaxID=34276 RepID=A0A5D2DJC4_GOSDA|nr:hypothetical protein ES288_D01G013300v1 [Gossypium darwinii]